MSDDGDDGAPPVFVVLDSGTSVDDDGVALPTVVIDPAGHPEVADLARVHATEGIGDVATEATTIPAGDAAVDAGIERLVVLVVSITVPVRCVFAVAIPLPEHRAVVDDALRVGRLVIATTPPDRAPVDRPLWLAIDLDPDRLSAALG